MNINITDGYLSIMSAIPSRIFPIPEIEAIILDHLDPVSDLKNVAAVNHHYYDLMSGHTLYMQLKTFCLQKEEHNKIAGYRIPEIYMACCYGVLEIVKFIYSRNKNIDETDIFNGFLLSCANDDLDIAVWLHNKEWFESYPYGSQYLDIVSSNYLDTTIWLYNLKPIDQFNDDEYFHWCCYCGCLDMAIWLYNLRTIDIHINNSSAFQRSCENDHVDTAIWLAAMCDSYQLTTVDNIIVHHHP